MTVWERRDLAVLKALATSDDENLRHGFLSVNNHGDPLLGLGLTAGDVHDAILALYDAGYAEGQVRYESGPGALFTHLHVTGRGQQALGQWPLFDEIASPATLALLLDRLAEGASTEEASALRRAAEYVRSLSAASLRAFAVAALSHVARAGLGLE